MNQVNKILEFDDEATIKKEVTALFFDAMKQLLRDKVIKTGKEFAFAITDDQSKISGLKREGRYVTVDLLFKAIHKYNIDPRFLFAVEKTKNVFYTGNKVSSKGSKNNVATGNSAKYAVVGNIKGNVTMGDQVFLSAPERVQQGFTHLVKYGGVDVDPDRLAKQLEGLKKTTNKMKEEITNKDKQIIELQAKLLELHDALAKKEKK